MAIPLDHPRRPRSADCRNCGAFGIIVTTIPSEESRDGRPRRVERCLACHRVFTFVVEDLEDVP